MRVESIYLLDGLQSERLNFRSIQESNFNEWLEFFKDPRTSIHWIEEKESPARECTKWYEKQLGRYREGRGGMNALIDKSSNKLVGHCGLLVQTVDGVQELEIGYSLLPEFWNRGYASEAAGFCCDFAFNNHLAESLISIISVTNKPSENVALKNGMTIDKTTVYNGNQVNIFRINQTKMAMLPTNNII